MTDRILTVEEIEMVAANLPIGTQIAAEAAPRRPRISVEPH